MRRSLCHRQSQRGAGAPRAFACKRGDFRGWEWRAVFLPTDVRCGKILRNSRREAARRRRRGCRREQARCPQREWMQLRRIDSLFPRKLEEVFCLKREQFGTGMMQIEICRMTGPDL